MSDGTPTFEAIYSQFENRIRRYLDGLVGPGEAEELTQETFLKVSRALPEFRGESQLSTWVFRIATNTARDRARARSYQEFKRVLSLEGDDPQAARDLSDRDVWTGDPPPETSEKLFRVQMNACIRAVVDELPQDHKAVILLSEFEGLKDREIAEVMGISLGSVKIRLHRARAKLRDALGQACTFHRDEGTGFGCEPTVDYAARLRDIRLKK